MKEEEKKPQFVTSLDHVIFETYPLCPEKMSAQDWEDVRDLLTEDWAKGLLK